MKVIIQALEIAIGISIIGLMIGFFSDIITSPEILDGFNTIFNSLSYLFGTDIAHYIMWFFLGTILIYCARWIISWMGTSGGDSPNK